MSKVEELIKSLQDVRQVYHEAIRTTVRETLQHKLDLCDGHCGRIVYPKDQWHLIPVEYRKQLNDWIIEHAGFGLCPACYRRAVRERKLSPVARRKILSSDEIEYLKRMAKGPQ